MVIYKTINTQNKIVIKLIIFFSHLAPFALSAQENSKGIEQSVYETDEKIPQLLQGFSFRGAAIAIIENGEIVLQQVRGFADIEKKSEGPYEKGF